MEENIPGYQTPEELKEKKEEVKEIIGTEQKVLPRKTKGNYIFPNILASAMRGISQRTQYEAEMMSTTCILLGLIVMTILTIFSGMTLWIKIVAVFNMMAGFVFLWSRLVTTIQQYYSYLQAVDLLNDWNEGEKI